MLLHSTLTDTVTFSHACKNEKKRYSKQELPEEMQSMLDQYGVTEETEQKESTEELFSSVSLSKGTFEDIRKRKTKITHPIGDIAIHKSSLL